MRSVVLTLMAGCGLTLGPVPALAQDTAAGARTQQIYVSVTDNKGNAIMGLKADAFTVREDGVAREIISVAPATEPLDVVLLVDDSQASTSAIPNIRDGLMRFINRMQGKAKIGIVTIGERPTSVLNVTDDPEALKKGVGRIFARPGAGAYLLEGINEVVRGFRLRETKRPTIVAVSIEGPEFSNLRHENVLRDLMRSGATLHVLAIGTPAPTTTEELRERGMVLAHGTERTGGRQDQLLSSMALQEKMHQLAGELLNQYLVTYGRPDKLLTPEKVEVGVKMPELTARARTRFPEPKKK